ncbi:P-loop containing nucleoside triphosphate hydrolase protein [Umbelopsis sp. PMI_123]|nr:P-loop containing nucleoside triphosphate hydrolase protein [Umbelopsis sp. PMI_123]
MKRSGDVRIEEDVEFDALINNKDLLKGIKASGYERPSPIQLKAIPLGRLGVDLIAQAKSGTGKTVVFGSIALEGIDLSILEPQVLIVAPTREIAVQITEVLRVLGAHMPKFQCQVFIGGLSVRSDPGKLSRCHVAVGTPGRIMALIQQGKLRMSKIKLAVLDEADKMIGGDFYAQTKYILDKLPAHKQLVAFSATFDDTLYDLLQKYMNNPQKVVLTTDTPLLEGVQQYCVPVSTDEVDPALLQIHLYEQKFKVVVDLLEKIPFYQCIVFLNHRGRAVDLTQFLNSNGWKSCHISSGISQHQRLEVMQKARKFRIRVLICSDLIARGIDIDRVNLVINLDFPKDVETYLHRIGRTGRFGTSGIAVNVTSAFDSEFARNLEDSGIHVKPLPDKLSLGSFTKELNDSEKKILESFETKRRKTKTDTSVSIHRKRKEISSHNKTNKKQAIPHPTKETGMTNIDIVQSLNSANVYDEDPNRKRPSEPLMNPQPHDSPYNAWVPSIITTVDPPDLFF